jgi:catechol 2,3-dioxygenase-like lactoylglutathione lyase family enzyme
VTIRLNQITLPALDVQASAAFFRGLGLHVIVEAYPRYARLECPDGGTTLSLHQVMEQANANGAVVYFECEDLDRRVEALRDLGYVFLHRPRDEPWLWREARLADPSGNVVCLFWAGENRRFPPWRVCP